MDVDPVLGNRDEPANVLRYGVDAKCKSPEVDSVKETVGCVSKRKPRKLDSGDENIINNGDMLTDNAINIVQNILHEQYYLMGGLEDTALGPCFSFSLVTGEFVQILHDGSLHWICVSNVGCLEPGSVNVYDSLKYGNIASHVNKQVASMLFHSGPAIKLNIQEVQQQDNGDWGPFAVACATSILHGENH